MTRVNVLPIASLEPKILSGEFHEITRVFGLVRKSVIAGRDVSDIDIKPEYLLGRGHVKFFYNKLEYVARRYLSLAFELRYRAIKSGNKSNCDLSLVLKVISEARKDIPEQWWGDYTPTPEAMEINQHRLDNPL